MNDILNDNFEEAEISGENGQFNDVDKDKLHTVNNVESKYNNVENTGFLTVLKDQLQVKDEQLKEKDSQIKIKDEQIKQKDNQLNELLILMNKEKDLKLMSDAMVYSKSKSSKNIFKRFFKKK